MAAQYTFLGTVRATCRVLNLWNGSSNNAPPAGWEAAGYDDSGWALSSVPDQSAAGPSAEYVAEGIQAVAPWVNPPNVKASFLCRFHFTAPTDPPWRHYQWDVQSPSAGAAATWLLWINGTPFVSQSVPVTQAGYYNYGADNVIALWADMTAIGIDWTASTGWAAMRQVFFIPTIGSQAYAWGTVTAAVNDKGFLGVGDTATHLTPTACVGLPANVARIVSNGKTTLFLTSDGSIWACGDNSTGLMLTGSTDTSVHATPVLVWDGSSNPIADISIGQDCALMVTSDGTVRGWGPNASGSLGLGDTTPRLSPVGVGVGNIGTVLYPGKISVGKNFSCIITSPLTVMTAGNNTYGQLGQGTSGAAVTTRAQMVVTNFPANYKIIQVSAGDDQTLIVADDTFGNGVVMVCGRAEYGSLSYEAYAVGTGPNKIVSTPILATSLVNTDLTDALRREMVQQAGPVTFGQSISFDYASGDGVPYGGTGDNGWDPSDNSYGHSPTITSYGKTEAPHALTKDDDPVFHTPAFMAFDGLAEACGGSQNPYAVGDSKAVFAAFGSQSTIPSDTLLYTWGWGGAGQMGSGADPTTNIAPISMNGLSDVIGATVCAAGMFAISAVAVAARRGRSFASVVG